MKIKNSKTGQLRQGDVLLIPIDKIPKNMKKVKTKTLALGEATGHHHSFVGNGAVCFANDEGADLAEYVQVSHKKETLTHQEHSAVTLKPKQNYRSIIQSQYTPEEIKRVVD